MTSKSFNRWGVKQSSSESSSASTSMGKSGPICWNCQELGHRRHNCKNQSYCTKCKQSGHLPIKCLLRGKRNEKSQTQQKGQQTSVDSMFSNIRNKCIRCGGDQTHALQRHILKSLQILQVIKHIIMAPSQVRLALMIFLLLAPRTASQLLQM